MDRVLLIALPRTVTKPLTMFALPNFMSWRSEQRERIHAHARKHHSEPVVPAGQLNVMVSFLPRPLAIF